MAIKNWVLCEFSSHTGIFRKKIDFVCGKCGEQSQTSLYSYASDMDNRMAVYCNFCKTYNITKWVVNV